MKRFSFRLATTAATIALIGCNSLPPPPPKATTPLEERGRHLLQIAAGCGCHGANFAGWRQGRADTLPRAAPFGERFLGPFGSVPASNITPDTDTGVGGWADADLERAITDGVNPAGERLAPQMPYRAYHGMAKSDVRALVAYLHRLRPVKNEVPGKTVKEAATSAGETLPAAPTEEEPPSEPVVLGRYLVQHVSACTDCHAPEDRATGQEGELPLTGKVLTLGKDSLVAPNLTPDRETGIGTWSAGDIARYLRTGKRPDGGLAQSVMAGLILVSFSKMTSDEASAVAAYLKSLPPVRHRPQ